jgi:hypothetical protein
VAHAYNPSYSGGRDQEDWGSKSDQANSSTRSYLKKSLHKRKKKKKAGGVTQGIGPEFKPSTAKKKEKSWPECRIAITRGWEVERID